MPCFVVKPGRIKKDGTRGQWSVYYESNVGERHEACLKKEEQVKWGFIRDWPVEKAREHASQLNAGNHKDYWDQKRYKVEQELRNEEKELAKHFLPTELDKFEKLLNQPNYIKAEVPAHWRYGKRIIAALNLNAFNWSTTINRDRIYSYFEEKKVSLSYTQKVLRAMNLWGEFLSEERDKHYTALKMPKGHQRQRIRDAQFKSGKPTNESQPMTPELLQKLASEMREDNYNWMYLSYWLGLRPEEVDSLKMPVGKSYKWEKGGDTDVILVYQTKLTAIDHEKRWKPIPLTEFEQKRCKVIIESGNFKRPLTKTIKRILGEGYGCYAGRKGFQDTMLGRGWGLENISIWMGHQSIERTWKSYKNKQKFTWKKVG